MKYLLPVLLTLAILCPALRAEAEPPPPKKVSVCGTAIIHVPPDEMLWYVQVSINDATLAKAKARHDTSLAAVIKYLQSLGTAVKDLQTAGVRFNRDYYPGSDSFLRHNPYSASTQVTFTLTDFEQYGPVTDALAKYDGIRVDSVDYASSKEAELNRDAMKRALLDAHSKADDLATTAGCRIETPLSIDEASNYNVRPELMNGIYLGGTTTGTRARTPNAVAGQIEFSARVLASYELLPPK